MNKLEKDFQNLVFFLEGSLKKEEHIQKKLKEIQEEDLPKQYQRAFRFYHSLSGDSRVFIFRLAKNPDIKKKFLKSKNKGFTSIKKLKAYSLMSYLPE